MSSSAVARSDDPPPGPSDTPAAQFTELRSLLVGPEQRQLRALQTRLEDPAAQARDVSRVLATAVELRTHDPHLQRALAPTIEDAITASVRRNPRPLADALFPIIGPAIRKAIAATLNGMLESLNTTLEHSLSWRSLRWRLDARRTGRPFAEIVLLNTLVYRVEQVFLIHRPSGLLLQHLRAAETEAQDADMVSGMLTAIRDFVQDSFHVAEDEGLQTLKVGDLSVWIEQGPHALLAVVVRGTAPPSLRTTLQQALEAVHAQYSDLLEPFDGDAARFEGDASAARELCPAAVPRARAARGSSSRASWSSPRSWCSRSACGCSSRCARGAGGMATSTPSAPSRASSSCPPAGPAGSTSSRASAIRWPPIPPCCCRPTILDPTPWRAAGSCIRPCTRRSSSPAPASSWRPPAGVSFEFKDGVLLAAGSAPVEWIETATRVAPFVPGVARFEATPVIDAALAELVTAIENATPMFVKGSTAFTAGSEAIVRDQRARLASLDALGRAARRQFTVELVGEADADGAARIEPSAQPTPRRTRPEPARAAASRARHAHGYRHRQPQRRPPGGRRGQQAAQPPRLLLT